MWVSQKVLDSKDREIEWLRGQVKYLSEKCDRLTEAITKRNSEVIVRLPEAPMVKAEGVTTAAVDKVMTEGPDQFVKNWFPQPKIATPRVPQWVINENESRQNKLKGEY